jgi:hypothetical protein
MREYDIGVLKQSANHPDMDPGQSYLTPRTGPLEDTEDTEDTGYDAPVPYTPRYNIYAGSQQSAQFIGPPESGCSSTLIRSIC